MKHFLLLLALTLVAQLQAGPRSSANYSITTDIADSGGTHATSAAYTNDGSAGSVVGIATVASPEETANNGYIGQLYEVTGLLLAASPTTLNVDTTLQLGGSQLLDDSTTIVLTPNNITWSVLSGPIASISSSGLATAGTVYQDTAALVQGVYLGSGGTLNLTVINVAFNAWQTQYFGGDNASAAPGAISDGSGLTNLFKYIAGLTPNDAASTFTVNLNPVSGQPGQRSIVFNPSLTDRTYTIESSTDLISWSTLSGPFSGNGSTQTVIDTNAGGTWKFYRVQVTYP